MFRGLYTLTSGMRTQQTNLNTISNNMANVSTQGYKADKLVATTFEEVLLSRTGNRAQSRSDALTESAMITVPSETVVNYEQGITESTGRVFDFALEGNGFFEIQQPDGTTVYSRNGSFTLDGQGNLFLQHVGRVMGEDGPINLGTDEFSMQPDGTIVTADGMEAGKLRVVDFADYTQLKKSGEGMFTAAQGGTQDSNAKIVWKSIERSNVQASDEVVAMMTSQRSLQSASQMIKIYDAIMNKAANDIGRI